MADEVTTPQTVPPEAEAPLESGPQPAGGEPVSALEPASTDSNVRAGAVPEESESPSVPVHATDSSDEAAVSPSPVAAPGEPAAAVDDPVLVGVQVVSAAGDGARPAEIPDLSAAAREETLAPIDLLDDVELDVKVELGRRQMYIEEVLRLGEGSVVELDKLAGDPVDVYVNEQLVARGEVLVLNDNFCVRINDIVSSTAEIEPGQS